MKYHMQPVTRATLLWALVMVPACLLSISILEYNTGKSFEQLYQDTLRCDDGFTLNLTDHLCYKE